MLGDIIRGGMKGPHLNSITGDSTRNSNAGVLAQKCEVIGSNLRGDRKLKGIGSKRHSFVYTGGKKKS